MMDVGVYDSQGDTASPCPTAVTIQVLSRIHTNQAHKFHTPSIHLPTTQATQTLVCSLVLSRLHYCSSLFSGCPQYLVDKLQKVHNAAARLVCKAKKTDQIHPIIESLHWLPVRQRIKCKISTICFNSISATAAHYLSDLLQHYTPARQ